MASNYKEITHCIFDMDGLLLDTERLYTQAFNRITNAYGKQFTWEHKAQTMGFKTREVTSWTIEHLELPLTANEFEKQLLTLYEELFPQAQFLPDSESVYKQIYQAIVSKHGYTYGGDLAYQVLGRPEVVGAELIINHYKLPITIIEFQDIYHRLQRELFVHVNMMPGAVRLLQHLKENNIPIALATSSSKDSFELKTKKLMDVFNLFHHRVLGGSDPDVKKGKPNPDIFLVAADRFPDKPDPSKCLVFEDAPNGVEAGISAGMQVVMVPDPNLPKKFTEKATLVLNCLDDFKPEEFGLPAFKN